MRARGVAAIVTAVIVLLVVASTCPLWSVMLPARLRLGKTDEVRSAGGSLLVAKQGALDAQCNAYLPYHSHTV